MRDASKARGVEHTGVFERRATPLAPMQRGPNALVISRRALRTCLFGLLSGGGQRFVNASGHGAEVEQSSSTCNCYPIPSLLLPLSSEAPFSDCGFALFWPWSSGSG